MTEQRKHPRLNESLMISHKLIKSVYKTGSRSSDISEGGLSFPVHSSIEPGTSLELEIHLPQEKGPIAATVEVVWLSKRNDLRYPFLVGVKFIKIDVLDRRLLRNYVDKFSKDQGYTDVRWIG